jgi:four helix bundle protein
MLVAYDISIELVRHLRTVVPKIAAQDRDLADQIRRAASSIPLNLGEGWRHEKGNKQKHYAIAHGSAGEVRAALETALAWGWIDEQPELKRVLDRLLGLLWGLTHRR